MTNSQDNLLLPISSLAQLSFIQEKSTQVSKNYVQTLQQKVQDLEARLTRKNKLIKYLQRKCVEQRVNTVSKSPERIQLKNCKNSIFSLPSVFQIPPSQNTGKHNRGQLPKHNRFNQNSRKHWSEDKNTIYRFQQLSRFPIQKQLVIQSRDSTLQAQEPQTISRQSQKVNHFLQNQKEILKKQLAKVLSENHDLKSEAEHLKLKLKQQDTGCQVKDDQLILENYKQILRIFGIQFQEYSTNRQQIMRNQGRVLQQIVSSQLQVAKILQQYKEIEQQLYKTIKINNQLRLYAMHEHRSRTRMVNMLAELNNEIMALRGNQTQMKFMLKQKQLQIRELRQINDKESESNTQYSKYKQKIQRSSDSDNIQQRKIKKGSCYEWQVQVVMSIMLNNLTGVL